MNRYVEAGLVGDAEAGKAVAVVGQPDVERRDLFRRIGDRPDTKGFRLVHGAERIDFASGGSIRFIPRGCGCLRGHRLDVVYVEGWNDFTDAEFYETFAGVNGAEMIRA